MILKLYIQHTIDLLKILYDIYKRKHKSNLFSELRSCLRSIMHKEFMHDFNIKMRFDSKTIILVGAGQVLNSLIILVNTPDSSNVTDNEQKRSRTIFAPVIYYMFPEHQRVGRMIIHKKEDNISKYLVHRSNYNHFPLAHPGGHIEYIETTITHKELVSGKSYIDAILFNLLNRNTTCMDNILIDARFLRWILNGTCREIQEEAGLDLSTYATQINLIKVGLKTHYFSVTINSDVNEAGPLEKFKSEIYADTYVRSEPIPIPIAVPISALSSLTSSLSLTSTPSTLLSSQHIDNNIKMSPNCYDVLCDIVNEENKTDTLKLDEFWRMRKNDKTHHAWITSLEMKTYWDRRYLAHIDKVIDATAH